MPGISHNSKKGWRYQFTVEGKPYSKAWFPTKGEAIAAREEHKKRVKGAARSGDGLSFREVANEYLDYSQRRFATKTHKYKTFVFRSFLAFAGDIPVDQLTIPLIESYLRTRSSNTNYNFHRKDLCALFTWAWKRRMITENPCLWLDKMPEEPYVKKIPTQEEMQRLIMAAGEDRPLILVLYHTLGRIDEVLRLRWRDVNFQDRIIQLWTRKRRDGAWASDAMGMNDVLYDTLWGLWERRHQEEWVFLNPKTGTRFMHRPKLMRTLCKQAGIPHYGFHAIRHYVASLLHDSKKVSLAQVSKLLRHQNKATTERYLQVIDPHSRDAMKSLEEGFLEKGGTERGNEKKG